MTSTAVTNRNRKRIEAHKTSHILLFALQDPLLNNIQEMSCGSCDKVCPICGALYFQLECAISTKQYYPCFEREILPAYAETAVDVIQQYASEGSRV